VVKLGFIVEGATEKILFGSDTFAAYLTSLNIEFVPEIINAKGIGKLLPHYISEFTEILKDKGATKIFIIADLETDPCVTKTKGRITPGNIHQCIISRKAIESWYLADSDAMQNFLGTTEYTCHDPENIDNPFEEIKTQRKRYRNRGLSDKKMLARNILGCGLSFEKITANPACTSAQYFHKKLIHYSTTL
jgi:hypothetical protein